MGYIWIILGVLSVTIFSYYILKKSRLDKIPLQKIRGLKEKNILGMKWYSLELTNGKSRDLTELKKATDISELKKMFSEIGIEAC